MQKIKVYRSNARICEKTLYALIFVPFLVVVVLITYSWKTFLEFLNLFIKLFTLSCTLEKRFLEYLGMKFPLGTFKTNFGKKFENFPKNVSLLKF